MASENRVERPDMEGSMERIQGQMPTSTFRNWRLLAKAGKEINVKDKNMALRDQFLLAFEFEKLRDEEAAKLTSTVDKVLVAVKGLEETGKANTKKYYRAGKIHTTSEINRVMARHDKSDGKLDALHDLIVKQTPSASSNHRQATPAPPAMDQGTMAEDTGAGLQGFLSQEELGKAAPVVEEQKEEENEKERDLAAVEEIVQAATAFVGEKKPEEEEKPEEKPEETPEEKAEATAVEKKRS